MLLLLAFAIPSIAQAADEYSEMGMFWGRDFTAGTVITKYEKVVGPYPSLYFTHAKKIGRGLVNIVTSPGELIKQPIFEVDKAVTPAEGFAAFFYGTLYAGPAWFTYRFLDGVVDINTSFFTLPGLIATLAKADMGPWREGNVIEPEYLEWY